ncbi:hypothetical protein CJD36_002745 [Flavipsychrobacter stenotrophus]|uniref:Response regulatory domain-containing protein n=1 Tax=Flavipsychrobacter stenotrophus TaxID=2077091 RepID=A0A2S7T0F3_9BACT|nr:response regulator [Flavipsychrobacter stenotrophus]PQJ12679.1 hypothetical protein CJD36_002745 [Flavipsychrobacter stenotrophus]
MTIIAMACQALTLAGIAGLLEASGIYKIAIRSSSGNDLIQQLQQSTTLPDLCIIGARPEGIDGYNTMQQINTRWPQLKTIVLTSLQSPVGPYADDVLWRARIYQPIKQKGDTFRKPCISA